MTEVIHLLSLFDVHVVHRVTPQTVWNLLDSVEEPLRMGKNWSVGVAPGDCWCFSFQETFLPLMWKVLFICFVTCIKDFIEDKWVKTAWEPGLLARAHTSGAQNLSHPGHLLIHSPVLPTRDTLGTDEGSLCMPCHFVLFRLYVLVPRSLPVSPFFSPLWSISPGTSLPGRLTKSPKLGKYCWCLALLSCLVVCFVIFDWRLDITY